LFRSRHGRRLRGATRGRCGRAHRVAQRHRGVRRRGPGRHHPALLRDVPLLRFGGRMQQVEVALVGAGVMGEAVLGSLGAAVGADRVRVTDGRPEHGREVAQRHGVSWAEDNAAAADGADVVVLAVKPKDVAAVCADLSRTLREGALVVSVAAGISTAYLADRLPAGTRVGRVMPNTPATIGRGIAALSAGASASEDALDLVAQLLAGTGATVRVPEDQQDVVTAVSGSGPAYVFYLLEAM